MKILVYLFLICFLFSYSVFAEFNSYIVKFKSKFELSKFFNNSNTTGAKRFVEEAFFSKKSDLILSSLSQKYLDNLEKYAIIDKNTNLDLISSNYQIDFIEPNYIYKIDQTTTKPNDAKYDEQWALKQINAENAWLKSSGKGVVVGVIDTGIDFIHPELKNQLWINSKEDINKNGKFDPWPSNKINAGVSGDFDNIDNDGNGFIDDVIGYDFVDQKLSNLGDYIDQDPIPSDEMGHGTLVSGIIAAQRDNNYGITGLAYNSKIMSVRAFDLFGNADNHNIANAMLYAAINGAKVINCSFGDPNSSQILHDAVKFAQSLGCIIVASSGNNGWNKTHYPSDYEGVISVGGSAKDGTRWGYSNYGDNLAFIAPGYQILSTDFFSSFATKNGTSFSSPYAAGLVALLLELNPNLTSNEVKGIISHSAKMPKTTDWSPFWGAGIIDCGEAVNNTPPLEISISFPENEQIFNRDSIKEISLKGSIIAPMLESYSVYLGIGHNTSNWKEIKTNESKFMINQEIAKIDVSQLTDTNYTFRIVATMKNGKIIEERRRFKVIFSNSLRIVSINQILSWNNGVRESIVGITTNLASKAKIRIEAPSGKYYEYSDFNSINNFHSIHIPNQERFTGSLAATVIAELTNGTKVESNIVIEVVDDYFPIYNYNYKNYKTKPLYLFNGITKLYDQNPSFIALDMSGAVLGNIYSFNIPIKNNVPEFQIRDSSKSSLIVTGYGDTNGDGINELLFKSSGYTNLFQNNGVSGNPFGKLLFASIDGNLWGQAIYNLDKLPNDEMLCYSDTAIHAFSYINGKYQMIAQAVRPNKFKNLGTLPGLALGDFDGDGNNDLAVSNIAGNIFVYSFINNALELQFIDSVNYSNSTQYMTSGDFDGDGKPEFAVLSNSSAPLFNKEDTGEAVHVIRVYKAITQKKYNLTWQTNISNVISGIGSNGISFRNNITSGNIDNDKNDEIVISLYPNVLAFKAKNINDFQPQMIINNTFTNNCIIYDFDKNGRNEVGYSDGNNTYFVELNKADEMPETPLNLRANLVNQNTIEFNWDKSPNAEYYELWRAILVNNYYELHKIATTNDIRATIDTFLTDQRYEFLVSAYNSKLNTKSSNYSDIIRVYTALPFTVKNVLANQKRLDITFKGKLKPVPIETSLFTLKDAKNNSFTPISAIPASDSLLILNFSDYIPYGSLSLTIEEFLDYWNNKVYKTKFNFTNKEPEKEEEFIYLSNLSVSNNNHTIGVVFSEEIKQTSIGLNNFKVYHSTDYPNEITNISIQDITIDQSAKNKVNINIINSELIDAIGKTYFVTCLNAESISGKKITKGAGNTLSFVLTNNELEKAYVYPNPIQLKDLDVVYFSNLPQRAKVEIFNINQNLIRTLQESDGNGGVKWDGLDENGNSLETGIYFFKVQKIINNEVSEESSLKKFAIIK